MELLVVPVDLFELPGYGPYRWLPHLDYLEVLLQDSLPLRDLLLSSGHHYHVAIPLHVAPAPAR